MQRKHLAIAVLSIGMLTLAACKKDKEEEKPKTTAEKLQAKWTLQTIIDNEHTGGEDSRDTTVGAGTDFFEFKPNGMLYVSFDGELDSVSYALQTDSKIVITQPPYASIYDIQTLTDNTLQLYTKEQSPFEPADYAEETILLKK